MNWLAGSSVLLLLIIFAAALLGYWLFPSRGKAVALLLIPLLLTSLRWTPLKLQPVFVFWLMLPILPATLLASVPGFIRAGRSRLSSPHD